MRALAPAPRFVLTALAWSLALFAALRLSWIDLRLVGWLVDVQRDIAIWYGATPTASVIVDSRCSGADVIALCLAVTLSYPVRWRRRLLGALGGTVLILALNTIRIGTLLSTAGSQNVFYTLHIYIWPAILILAMGVYVLWWIGRSGRTAPATRFGLTALAMLALHAAAVPWTMTSAAVLRAGDWTAQAAARLLSSLGVAATADGNILWTPRGAFQVTQECLLTPLVPIYLAGVIALPMTARTRLMALVLALPVFLVLGILRVLVLALPPEIVASPLIAAHGFYQMVAAAAGIAYASAWALRRADEPARRSQIAGRAALAIVTAIAVAVVAGDVWGGAIARVASVFPRALTAWSAGADVQGALPLLPAFQLGLLAGLWLALSPFTRFARLAFALAILAASQLLLLLVLGEAARADVSVHALVIRAWALAIPIALAWLLFRQRAAEAASYGGFWEGVGESFPDLGGAASTDFYRANEIRLISSALGDMRGLRILKTDLWDEARNTRIMQWASSQGAEIVGIDISPPTLRKARDQFEPGALKASLADVRRLPFADASVDAIYSMGTIEHFDESEDAVAEMARVLKPGGRLILGVPNRFDPFFRPVMVWVLWCLGLYGYGFEKSYSRRELRRMLERADLEVVDQTGILFIPGWLRIADLVAHTRVPALRPITRAAVRTFVRLDARFPSLRRHGYLIAAVARRPT